MRKGLVIAGALAFIGPSSLFGNQILQTQSLGNTNLEITGPVGTFSFNDFLNYGIANAILTSVTLELKVGETFAGTLTYVAGEQKAFVTPSLTYTDDSGMVTALSVNPYDVYGVFTLGFTTTTFSGAMGSGGNFGFDQATLGNAMATVIYNYSLPANTPEPATFVLIASALIGFVFLANRRVRKF